MSQTRLSGPRPATPLGETMTVNRVCQIGHGSPTGTVAADLPVADLLTDAVGLIWTVAATGFVLSGDVLSCVYSAAQSWAEPRSLDEAASYQVGDRVCAALASYLVRSGLADPGQSTSQSIRQWASGSPASVITAELRDAADHHRLSPGAGPVRPVDQAVRSGAGVARPSRVAHGRVRGGRSGFLSEYVRGYARGATAARSLRD